VGAELRAVDGSVLLFDCLRPALDALGLSEDKDGGGGSSTSTCCSPSRDVRGVVVHHAAHTGERSRGDSRFRDWPDVEWHLVREQGEDDEQASDASGMSAPTVATSPARGAIWYDQATRRLTLVGGSRKDTAADLSSPTCSTTSPTTRAHPVVTSRRR
jgi:hypothetical protein